MYSLVGTAASIVLLPLLLLGIGCCCFPIPSTDDAVQNQIATVSYADGGQLARLVPEQGNRIKVGMDAIPIHVREAVLAAEDGRSTRTRASTSPASCARWSTS
ncbi:hypothetical protein [Pseudonocardia sp. ICBG601]|uniref:hypothetical protein n=1 Tax=Pseudonocardia sp. ICBG601 TaxID=2846759 RepID=UPI001CF65A39|nr:hypothetical protein [Pseudonocardia sp. ICBG601]